MKIHVSSSHRYPASIGGIGSDRITDLLVKGLAELGHDVFYFLEGGQRHDLPTDVNAVTSMTKDADILHVQNIELSVYPDFEGMPWVRTLHTELSKHVIEPRNLRHFIFVSKHHARCHDSERFVYNAVDPEEFYYSETKDDYFLFVVSGLQRLPMKGLNTVLMLVKREGIRLKIAVANPERLDDSEFARLCRDKGIEYIGQIHGKNKAEQFAGAKALLFPTMFNEAFGLVIVEALVSGTPVICSDNGACKEIVTPDVGVVCSSDKEYVAALTKIENISPKKCKQWALENFHYRQMTNGYIKEYEQQIHR